jgi:hypothetical protein
MAVGTLLTTVLQNVPWSDVVANAPAIADGAKKLWGKVARGRQTGEGGADPTATAEGPAHDIPALQARIQSLQADVGRLEEEMAASSSLLKALAEQNAVLIERIEQGRRRMNAVSWVAALALCAAAGGWVWAWTH